MPFDDLKTLPEGFAVTQPMQPVAWAVEYAGETLTLHNSLAHAADYAKYTREDGSQGRVVPLYRSPPVAAPAVDSTMQPVAVENVTGEEK